MNFNKNKILPFLLLLLVAFVILFSNCKTAPLNLEKLDTATKYQLVDWNKKLTRMPIIKVWQVV